MKRWVWLATLSVLVVGTFLYAETQSPLAIEPFNEGVKRFNAQQYAEAISYFDRAISHDAYFAEAYYARGACQHSLHHSQEAIADLNRAVELNPQIIDAFTLRGVVSYEREQWDTAFKDFDYVLSQKPDDPQSLLGRGAIYIQREALDKAEKDFRAFLRVRPDDPMAPRVRKVLASLSKSTADQEAPEEPGTTEAGSAPKVRIRTARMVTPAMKQMTSELLFQSHRTSEEAARKAIRGEQSTVTGDRPENTNQ